jgi:hypothetical protein
MMTGQVRSFTTVLQWSIFNGKCWKKTGGENHVLTQWRFSPPVFFYSRQ